MGRATRGCCRIISALIIFIGIGLTMDTTAHAQIKFDLQPPTYYFNNPASLALLQAALHGDQAKARELVADGANPNDEGPSGR